MLDKIKTKSIMDKHTMNHIVRNPETLTIIPDKESENLLDEIWEHATQEKYTWTQKWEKGDLLMWKNLNVLHKRDAFDPNTRRVMHRTQLKGEIAITA